jgi:sugar lactone lactonase YvrE
MTDRTFAITFLLHLGLYAPGAAQVAFTIPVPDMIPEGIAHDPVENAFYMGSTYHRNVYRVDANRPGTESVEFIKSGSHGLWGIVGMRVDPAARLLWLASSHAGDGMPMMGMDPAEEGSTGLFAFDIETGELRHRAVPDDPGFLNDVAIARDGTPYVTDSESGRVYRFAVGTGLAPFVELGHLGGPNGIDFTEDERFMFVAVGRGIARVDMASREIHRIARDTATAGVIDGLYVTGRSLVVVQPYEEGRYVTRIDLNDSLSAVVAEEPLLMDYAGIDQPTTGAVVGPDIYVIANAHLQTFRRMWAEDRLEEASSLSVPEVLRIPVRRNGR